MHKSKFQRKRIIYIRIWFRRKMKNYFFSTDTLTETQKLAVSIVKNAIIHPNAELLIAPISGSHYIAFDKVYICITKSQVTIVNGKYSYDVSLPDGQLTLLIDKFERRLEVVKRKWDDVIITKTTKNLNLILQELTETKS